MLLYYEVLGVHPSVPAEKLKEAYHAAARAAHPDKNADAAKTVCQTWYHRIQAAWDVLKNPLARQEYDLRCSTSLPPGWHLGASRKTTPGAFFYYCPCFGSTQTTHTQISNPATHNDIFDHTVCEHCAL